MQLFTNNAVSSLASGVNATDNTLVLVAGDGAKFPAITGEDFFLLTLTQGVGLESSWEIVKCTARSGDSLTVVRAQEGTAGQVWAAGSKVDLRVTAGTLEAKEASIPAGTSAQYWRGDKTWRDFFTDVRAATLTGLSTATNAVITASDTVLTMAGKLQKQVSDNLTTLTNHTANTSNPHSVTKAQVGLGNVDNTSDADKPISSATQTALDAKAPLASPTFTDTPTAPTAAVGTNTTQLATTAFVQAVNASDTGSAATAVALKTARQINGTSFDGSANVTTANWGTARTITIGSTGKSVNGSGDVTWTLAEIGAGDVTLTGTQTLTNKTLTSPTTNLVKFGSQYAAGNSGTAVTVNFANGQKQALTLTGNATVTISCPGVGNYQLILTQDATGSRTVTWSGVSRYVGSATAPAINTAANTSTVVSIYFDGTNLWLAASKVNA